MQPFTKPIPELAGDGRVYCVLALYGINGAGILMTPMAYYTMMTKERVRDSAFFSLFVGCTVQFVGHSLGRENIR